MEGYCHIHQRPHVFSERGQVYSCPVCHPSNEPPALLGPDEYPFLSPLPSASQHPIIAQPPGYLPGFFPDGNIHPTAIVSMDCRYRRPELFRVGAHSVVDDWGYFSTQVQIGRGCHIGAGVNISGGPTRKFTLGDFSAVTYHSDIVCASPDYVRQLVTISGWGDPQEGGDVTFEAFTGAATKTTIFWNNTIPEGTVILAGAIVRPNYPFEPWGVYGIDPMRPHSIRRIMPRDRDAVLRQAEKAEKWMLQRDKA